MTTPEQIIAKIEEIESFTWKSSDLNVSDTNALLDALLRLKQTVINVFNLPTADPPKGSPGQEDLKG